MGSCCAPFRSPATKWGRAERHGPEADVQSQRVTLQVHVEGQQEFDHYWYGLLDGGKASKNGWLVDRFGVWWDIVPV